MFDADLTDKYTVISHAQWVLILIT
jgi:hypothetical protein